MTKQEAFKLAIEHKEKSATIYVVAGNVFFETHKNYAEHHAKEMGVELFAFTSVDFQGGSEEKKPSSKKK